MSPLDAFSKNIESKIDRSKKAIAGFLWGYFSFKMRPA